MIAAGDLKDAAGAGVFAFFHILDPSAIDGERNMVLGFARHGTCVATDALAVVNDEAVFHSWKSLAESAF
jgi:hypothetical protein